MEFHDKTRKLTIFKNSKDLRMHFTEMQQKVTEIHTKIQYLKGEKKTEYHELYNIMIL